MGMLYEDLEELCHAVEADLQKTNEKLRMSGGEMSGSDLEYVDKLTHTIKSIKTTMAMMDADEGYSREDIIWAAITAVDITDTLMQEDAVQGVILWADIPEDIPEVTRKCSIRYVI